MSEADTKESAETDFEHTYERLWDAYERWAAGDAVDITIEVEGVDVALDSPEYDTDFESPNMALSLPEHPPHQDVAQLSRTSLGDKWEFEMRVRSAVRELIHGTEPRPR